MMQCIQYSAGDEEQKSFRDHMVDVMTANAGRVLDGGHERKGQRQ